MTTFVVFLGDTDGFSAIPKTNSAINRIEMISQRFIGAYIYGKQGDHCYIRHIGNDWRMASWQLKGGQPGGVHNSEQMDKRFMPPWCIPHYKDGPTSRGDVSKAGK